MNDLGLSSHMLPLPAQDAGATRMISKPSRLPLHHPKPISEPQAKLWAFPALFDGFVLSNQCVYGFYGFVEFFILFLLWFLAVLR